MPVVYVKNELYNRIVKAGKDPKQYVNDTIERDLDKLDEEKKK